MERKEITIFTDGSCEWKSRLGGCGVYIQEEGKEYFISKGYSDTTISRCELRAILHAVQSMKKDMPLKVTIWSDSQYAVSCMTDPELRPVANKDIIEKIRQELNARKRMRVRFMKVRGHEKDVNNPIIYGNHVADMLADYKNFDNYELDKTIEL